MLALEECSGGEEKGEIAWQIFQESIHGVVTGLDFLGLLGLENNVLRGGAHVAVAVVIADSLLLDALAVDHGSQ